MFKVYLHFKLVDVSISIGYLLLTRNQHHKWNIGHPWQLLFEINSYAPLDASHEAQIITTSEKWKIRLKLNSSFNGKPTPRVLIEENISMKLRKTQSETQENHEYRCLAKIWKLPQDEMAKHMWMLIGIYFLQAKRFNDDQSSSFGFRLCNDSKHEFHLYKKSCF